MFSCLAEGDMAKAASARGDNSGVGQSFTIPYDVFE